MSNQIHVVVYVDLDLVGDALTKLPFLRALRNAWPDGHLTWVAGRGASAFAGPLRGLTTGLVDRVLERTGIGPELAAVLRTTRAGPPDVLIDTQSKLGTSLALRRVGARRFISPAAGFLLSDRRPWFRRAPPQLVARLLRLVALASGRPADPDGDLPQAPATAELAARLLPAGERHVALVVGAGGRHKAWPVTHHVELARALQGRGFTPAMILGPDEADWRAGLAAALPGARFPLQDATASGATTGPDLTIALARRCVAGVAADCGGGHMLSAARIPLVSLFGPTDPAKFAPWTPRLVVLRGQDWGGQATGDIPVTAVLEAVEKLAG
ncbi:Glycosyltransferase family 9 protein [Rhodovastum atsumiense]|nr:glycosyltransferase family 9 protein [Rhodovastum atsumiense]CAH2600085.1 Glycosyltransferase family 9 protein [Rhodovastum atsumiense]